MRRPLTLLAAVALVMTACNGTSGDTTTTVAVETSSSAPGATTTTGAGVTTTTASETTTTGPGDTASTGATAGGPDCLVGTWVLDTDSFVENFDSIFAEAGMGDAEVTALGGSFTAELEADGTMTAVRDRWGFSIVTPEGTISIEINGEETGTWSAQGSTLSVDTDVSDLSVDASVEVDGETISLPEAPVDTPAGIATDSEFTCSGDVLTLTNDGVVSVMNRA